MSIDLDWTVKTFLNLLQDAYRWNMYVYFCSEGSNPRCNQVFGRIWQMWSGFQNTFHVRRSHLKPPKIQPKSSFTWAGIYLEDFWGSQMFFSHYGLRCFFGENSRCDVNFHQVKAPKSAVSSGPKAPSVFQDYRFLWTFSRGAIRSRPESSGQVASARCPQDSFGKSVGFWGGGFFSIPTGSMGLVIFAYILP